MAWFWRRKRNLTHRGIEPDEIFLDSKNLPGFNRELFEGRLERPISSRAVYFFYGIFIIGIFAFVLRLSDLQMAHGEELRGRADSNRLVRLRLPAERGLIYDRAGTALAWNDPGGRQYSTLPGLSHVVGFVGLPDDLTRGKDPGAKVGKAGTELALNKSLEGQDGSHLVEESADGNVVSEGIEYPAVDGDDVVLTIDAAMQSYAFERVAATVRERGFHAGSALIVNPTSGEILAATSFPEYDLATFSASSSQEAVDAYRDDAHKPFFFRAFEGLYSPGSIFKTIVAAGALTKGVISPEYKILGTRYISVPNPYNPQEESRFYDWREQGWVDMRKALAVSSNVYFYTVGGGYGDIRGLGALGIADFARRFGLGSKVGVELPEKEGLVPTPDWKAKNQPSDPAWRIGDTYNYSIGQGMLQVTPLQMAQVVSLIAMNGAAPHLHLVKEIRPETTGKAVEPEIGSRTVGGVAPDVFQVIKEGMKGSVQGGTASALSGLGVSVAGKTGTAEIGTGKQRVNSWFMGFLPYENPRLAVVVALEGGDAKNLVGAPFVAREIVSWIVANRSEYAVDNLP